jgi:radical SAM superfamily enzyme YgiQ (UPF0313 family)
MEAKGPGIGLFILCNCGKPGNLHDTRGWGTTPFRKIHRERGAPDITQGSGRFSRTEPAGNLHHLPLGHTECQEVCGSIRSLIREATRMTKMPGFKGIIQDVGGPTANMYGLSCDLWEKAGACRDKRCSPACRTLHTGHGAQCELLTALRKIPGVRKVFIGSGIRYDLLMEDQSGYLDLICDHHVSGHLKVAPEHIAKTVTGIVNKPPQEVFDRFREQFSALQEGKQKKQYILPYFMSGHPGCTVKDMVQLAEYIRDNNLYTEQVQDFTPTPMSVSTCMYYTGLNPFTMEPVHVAKGREKQVQRALLQYREPRNRSLVMEGLESVGRKELIGGGQRCLVSGVAGIPPNYLAKRRG